MTKTETIAVKSVNVVKNGVSAGNRPWTLLNVVADDGRKFSTFDESYLKASGHTIEITYEKKEEGSNPKNNGRPYINRNIIQAKQIRTGGGANGVAEINNTNGQIIEKLFTKLNLMQAEIEKIGKMMKELMDEAERPPMEDEEIKPEDVPF